MDPSGDVVRPARVLDPRYTSANVDRCSDLAASKDSIDKLSPAEIAVVELSSSESSLNGASFPNSPTFGRPISDVSIQILDVIFDYALNKFSDSRERLEAGRPKFLSVIESFVSMGNRIETCLPAFPFSE